MVVVMLPVASKQSLLELGYLCASAELTCPIYKARRKNRGKVPFEQRKAGRMEKHRKEQANRLMNACIYKYRNKNVHVSMVGLVIKLVTIRTLLDTGGGDKGPNCKVAACLATLLLAPTGSPGGSFGLAPTLPCC